MLASAGINELTRIVDPWASALRNRVATAVVLTAVDKKVRREKLEVIGLISFVFLYAAWRAAALYVNERIVTLIEFIAQLDS
jgi:hypothetical protein